MKSFKAIRLFWLSVKIQFKRELRKHTVSSKYAADGEKLYKQYFTDHPDATHRMAKRHAEREVRKMIKKEKSLKKE